MSFQLAPYAACAFCGYVSGESECTFVAEDELATALVTHRQYERGGVIVIPKRHRETILDVEDAELASMYRLAKRLARAQERAFGACGANIFQNNGVKAGQHVPHVHVHVVPRYADSDPERLFLQRDFPVIPLSEQQAIGSTLRAALEAG
jgi:histidine triad (HIT) family protein